MPPIPRAGLRGLGRALLVAVVLGVVLGVIAMHHVVGGHAHGATSPLHHTAPAPSAAAAPAAGPAAAHPPGPPSPSSAAAAGHSTPAAATSAATPASAFLADHDAPDTAAMLLHLCLAVLAGLVTLAALALTRAWPDAGPDRRDGSTVVAVAALPRAPPLPARLAQLQVLRL